MYKSSHEEIQKKQTKMSSSYEDNHGVQHDTILACLKNIEEAVDQIAISQPVTFYNKEIPFVVADLGVADGSSGVFVYKAVINRINKLN